MPGLEDMSSSELKLFYPKDLHEMSRDIVRREMQDKLLPFEGKRSHRKINGMMLEFIEMSRMMCNQWKLVDKPIKRIFKELADEGKKLHRERLSEYTKDEVEVSVDDKASAKEDSLQDVAEPVGQLQEPKDIESLSSDDSEHPCLINTEALPVLAINKKVECEDLSLDCTPCSPRPTKYGKVNIVTPITSRPKVVLNGLMALAEPASNEECDDEFCKYIDSHIHLVEGVETDVLDLDLDNSIPRTFMDLITMDESIDHCRLAAGV